MRVFLILIAIFPMLMSHSQIVPSTYDVQRLKAPMSIDANWSKPQWQGIREIEIKQVMGPVQSFMPVVRAKMMYDDKFVYVIFRVEDKFVRSVATSINGRIWEDSCVEFFFAPDVANPMAYFNLEINAGGYPLFHVKDPKRPGAPLPSEEDIKKIEIASTLPRTIDPEIQKPTVWSLEYRIPIEMLKQYSGVRQPAPGVQWNGNFYKCGDKTSNPHWLTWSEVGNPTPNFHLPQFFGALHFK